MVIGSDTIRPGEVYFWRNIKVRTVLLSWQREVGFCYTIFTDERSGQHIWPFLPDATTWEVVANE